LTYLEAFKTNPTNAQPYIVITCFDELVRTKGIALIRADLILEMTQDEGQATMDLLLSNYLVDSSYEKVKQFNHNPG
jgi:ATP synthase F1 complex assembly factor 1